MTALMAASLSALMIATAFLSGIFGMAGGLILIGVLLVVLPLPQAMVLHAVTQMASNGWRAFLWWRHIEWKIAAASIVGSLLAVGLWSIWLYVPDKAVALLLLGLSPFIVRAIPDSILPRNLGPGQMLGGSAISMMLMLLTGVTGPLLDTLFLRSPLERKQIIATKAACQVFSHSLKLIYFGALIDQAGPVEPWFLAIAIASSMIGTSLGKLLLEKLSDKQFRPWSNRIITTIATYYVGYSLVLWRASPNGLFLPIASTLGGAEEGSRAIVAGARDPSRLFVLYNGVCPFRPRFLQASASSLKRPASPRPTARGSRRSTDGRAIRGFLPGRQHANALGIVHGGMLAAFLDSAMGTAVFHTLNRRAVTLRLSLDYLGPGRIGDWLQAEGEVVGHDEHVAQVRGRLYGPRHEVLTGLGAFALLSRQRTVKPRG